MKVTMLSTSKGGMLSYTTNLAWRMAHQGDEVNVFFLTSPAKSKHLMGEHRLHFYYLTAALLPNPLMLIKFFFYDHPDVIHVNFGSFGPLAILKKFVFKTPFILVSHGLPQPWLEPSWFEKVKYTIECLALPFVASQASAVVAVSDYVKRALKLRYDIDSAVIGNGVSIDEFVARSKKRSKYQLGYDVNDFLVLFVGKLHPYKDPITLIKAFNIAAGTNADLRLLVVGAGELHERIVHEIERLGLSARVKLLQRITDDELILCYSASDLFVLPSVNEAFGIVLLEAMACGLPIVASNSGACPELVGNAGRFFSRGDYRGLATILTEVSNDENKLRRMSEEGLKRVKLFSWEKTANQYLELYVRILSHAQKSLLRLQGLRFRYCAGKVSRLRDQKNVNSLCDENAVNQGRKTRINIQEYLRKKTDEASGAI